MTERLTPMEVVDRLICPRKDLHRVCGLKAKACYNWGPDIPKAEHMRSILSHCSAQGIPLKPEWLIEGADIRDIHAALDAMKAAA